MIQTGPHARLKAQATCHRSQATAPEIQTALIYHDEFAGLAILWRIGPALLFGSLSWAPILYFLFR